MRGSSHYEQDHCPKNVLRCESYPSTHWKLAAAGQGAAAKRWSKPCEQTTTTALRKPSLSHAPQPILQEHPADFVHCIGLRRGVPRHTNSKMSEQKNTIAAARCRHTHTHPHLLHSLKSLASWACPLCCSACARAAVHVQSVRPRAVGHGATKHRTPALAVKQASTAGTCEAHPHSCTVHSVLRWPIRCLGLPTGHRSPAACGRKGVGPPLWATPGSGRGQF